MARNIRQADGSRAREVYLASESAAPAPSQPLRRRDADVTTTPLPPVVDEPTWRRQLDEFARYGAEADR
jgi:hypothetical protein